MFVLDVDLWTQFMHPSLLSVGMMKLPLPCSTALWQAKSADEWARQMNREKQSSRVSTVKSLRASIELLLSCPDQSRLRRLVGFSAGAFTLQILIHGLASAVFEHKFRSVDSGYSEAFNTVKLKEFEQGLECWYNCFEHMQLDGEPTELARSSLVKYHLISILLRESLSDIQMAAGTAYSWGRAVTPQRAQDAFTRLVSGQHVARESYQHGLRVLLLCLVDTDSQDNAKSSQDMAQYPLNLTYVPFIAVLVLWAYALSLSRTKASAGQRDRMANRVWTANGDQLEVAELTQLHATEEFGQSFSTSAYKDPTCSIEGIIQRGLARRDILEIELETIRNDVRQLMSMAQKRLAESPWELGTCTEVSGKMSNILLTVYSE